MIKCANVKHLLTAYEQPLGQAVNYQKSDILFGSNISDENKVVVSSISGVHQSLQHGRYVGLLSSIIGKNNK